MSLTDREIRNIAPTSKRQRYFDERGLYLEVAPSGGKWWRFKYRFAGKEKRLSLGVYPEIGLKEARIKCAEVRAILHEGIDPGEERKQQKAALGRPSKNDSFEVVAREWFAKFAPQWAEGHAETVITRLEKLVFPYIGKQAVDSVSAPDVLAVLRRMEVRGTIETARRVRGICSQVFRYAVATSRAERDPAADLIGALPPVKQKHHASITDPKGIGGLLRAIDAYTGSFVVKCALQLAPLTFVRPGELRRAEWSEFDLEAAEWRIPAEKMKMKTPHIVPLSRQAIAVMEQIRSLTGCDRYVFPSGRTIMRPMSENAVTAALRRMGFTKEEMTGHGFRSMASTLLNEQGYNRDWIERQLAHSERDGVRAAYNYAEYLPERRRMMQEWADFLDSLRSND